MFLFSSIYFGLGFKNLGCGCAEVAEEEDSFCFVLLTVLFAPKKARPFYEKTLFCYI
jgi:hypothetical protein